MIFDASTLISISQTCLVNLLAGLKREMNAEFIVPKSVYYEAVQKPISIKRFELNAIRIKKVIEENGFKVLEVKDKKLFDEVAGIANACFFIKGKPIKLLQRGEIEALALVKEMGAVAFAIDERTTRVLLEAPEQLRKILQARRRVDIKVDRSNVKALNLMFPNITMVRSVELIALAEEFGLLEKELPKGAQSLEAALFAAKYSGCAVSAREINMFLQGKKW